MLDPSALAAAIERDLADWRGLVTSRIPTDANRALRALLAGERLAVRPDVFAPSGYRIEGEVLVARPSHAGGGSGEGI